MHTTLQARHEEVSRARDERHSTVESQQRELAELRARQAALTAENEQLLERLGMRLGAQAAAGAAHVGG